MRCDCAAILNADSNCSTLVVKQKLPGVYVQPSYRSALSKFKFNFENFNNYVFLNSSAQENCLTCSVVWSDIHKTRAVPGWCVQIYRLYS